MVLSELIGKAVFVLRETKAQFKNPCVMWSMGKDSTAMLRLCQDAFLGQVPFPVVHIDTGRKFKEMYEFRDRLTEDLSLDLVVAKSPFVGSGKGVLDNDHETCCQRLKTNVLRSVIEEHGFDAVIVSIRRDEHYIRNIERVSSPRDKQFRWQTLREKKVDEVGDAPFESLQHVELWDNLQSNFGEDCHHVRRHPILSWSEFDVWHYIKLRGLPVNPLYFSQDGKRYRSLGCECCTKPIVSDASTIDEVMAELQVTKDAERAGRCQDKEAGQVMRKLKAMGYF